MGDVTKYEAVLKIDYQTIFNKLYKQSIEAEIERNLHEKHNKTNS